MVSVKDYLDAYMDSARLVPQDSYLEQGELITFTKSTEVGVS